MFAIIETGGKQYQVAKGDVLKVDKLDSQIEDMVEFKKVLMVGQGCDFIVGSPVVEGACVSAQVLKQERAEKVVAFKKRRRQNSRRTIGSRRLLTEVRIDEIISPRNTETGSS